MLAIVRTRSIAAPLVAMALAAACASSATGPGGGNGGSGGSAGAGGVPTSVATTGGSDSCECAPGPHNEVIYTLSDEAEIWAYDPQLNSFSYLSTLLCTGLNNPYSMAVDQLGQAWVLSADNGLIYNVDPTVQGGDCQPSSFAPHQVSFDLFGMAFVRDPDATACPQMFVHSYSGQGPFTEGPGLGQLGRIDPQSGELTLLGDVDYDGGEMAGTADGRLFAFAGVQPAKLVAYDRDSGATLQTTPLTGLSKTNASAFAFFGGDFYFFTEAWPSGCETCLLQSCPTDFAACQADEQCSQQLQCAIDNGDIQDECGGLMPAGMVDCVANSCGGQCLLPSSQKVSRVTHLDIDGSSGGGLNEVLAEAPIRIVGAGNSVCVPLIAE